MAETLTLTKPIRVGGEDVSELTLTEPTIGMLDGVKLRITADGELNIDLGAICVLLGRMANIPPSAAKSITIKDAAQGQGGDGKFFSTTSSKLARPSCRTSVVLPLAAE